MEKNPKKPRKKYECKKCVFSTVNKKDFNRHLTTRKHQRITKNKKKPILFNVNVVKFINFVAVFQNIKKLVIQI